MLVMGVDLGTSGARAMVVSDRGQVVAAARWALPPVSSPAAGWAEQRPEDWWRSARLAIRRSVSALRAAGHSSGAIAAVCVTGTSGTMVLLDQAGRPLRPAIMYSDSRAGAEAAEVQAAGRPVWDRLGYRMGASFGLPKLLWVKRHEPATWAATRWAVHAADYLSGLLSGEPGTSDYSNALKTGYDLLQLAWPAEVLARLDLEADRFPRVLAPGDPVGRLAARAARETGLPAGIPVVAGMTDGCTSQIAAGAVSPGQWATTIGSTLVVKGVTRSLLRDPAGAVYCHRHPEGYWMPGGAANTGGAAVARRFGARRLGALERRARFPTDVLIFPLEGRGERFPFAHPGAEGFTVGVARDEAEAYAACLEGIAYVERLAYDRLVRLGAQVDGPVCSAGGGARSPAWLQVRADVLDRPVSVPTVPEAAFGAAAVALAHASGQPLSRATRSLVRPAATYEPRPALARAYAERFARFRAALVNRGYLEGDA